MKQLLKDWALGSVSVTRWILLAVLLLLLLDGRAWGATNLAWVCADTSKAGQAASGTCSPQRWDYADKGLVAVGTTNWSDNVWRVASSATGNALACTLDVAPGSTAACGANYAGERYLPVAQLAISAVNPPDPPVVNPPTQPATGTALLTWVNPPDAITAIDVWQAEAAAGPFRSIATLAPVSSYTVAGLAVGPHWWYVTASIGSAASLPSNTVTKTITATTPVPVDCAVGAWSEWTGGAWSACLAGTQTRQETRTRSVLTQPANGGAACPALTETRTASQPCTVVPVDPCVADPLTITNVAWPTATTGRRSLGYNTGTKALASLVFTAPNRIVFTDTRGCTATVTR